MAILGAIYQWANKTIIVTWNHLTVCKQMSTGLLKNDVTNKLFAYKSYVKYDLALNNH